MDNRGIAGIGHNQGPSMSGLSTLPIAEKAIGGAVIKGLKTGLKNLNTMFESVGSGLKKSGFKKDERKEASKAIQNEIDKVSKENNRKFRPRILRMEKGGSSDGSSKGRSVVIAAVDDENGKIAAIMTGNFSKIKDMNKKIENRKGILRDNPSYNKDINRLYVGGFFGIQDGSNAQIKELLEVLNVPIYAKGEGVVTPEQLHLLNTVRVPMEGAYPHWMGRINRQGYEVEEAPITSPLTGESSTLPRSTGLTPSETITGLQDKRVRGKGMGHHEGKIDMGPMGVYRFGKSLMRGLPITDSAAGRISGSKTHDEPDFNIRNAPIYEGVTPFEDLPDIDVSAELLEEMGDEGLRSLTPSTLGRVTKRIVPTVNVPPNVKKLRALWQRIENEKQGKTPDIKDPYAKRAVIHQEAVKTLNRERSVPRILTIGEQLPSDESMIEKLQYGLLNRLSGNLSGKKGLLSLIKRGDDEIIVGSRSPTDEGQVMITAEGERLVPRKQLFDPRVRKERVSDTPLGDIPDSSARRNITPETRENARRFEEYRDTRGRVLDDDSLGDNPEPPSNIGGSSSAVRSNLTNTDQIIDAYNEGIITEGEGWNRLTELINSGRISTEEGLDNATRFRQALGRGDGRLEEGSIGTYNDDGSINVELPDGTRTTTRLGRDDLGRLLNQVEDGIVNEEEAMSIIEALETAMVINTEDAIRFQSHLDQIIEPNI